MKIVIERIENKEKKTKRIKIDSSKYNEIYKRIKTKEVPEYLNEKRRKKEQNTIARFRCGNEARGSQEWREEKKRKCRICGRERKSLEHIIKKCEERKSLVHIIQKCEETKSKMTIEEL